MFVNEEFVKGTALQPNELETFGQANHVLSRRDKHQGTNSPETLGRME